MFGRKPDPIMAQQKMLQDEIERVKLEMETAYSNFEQVLDPDLIDCYIYEVNAVQKRYKYLLQEAAKMNIASETPKSDDLYEKSSIPLMRQTFREFPFSVG